MIQPVRKKPIRKRPRLLIILLLLLAIGTFMTGLIRQNNNQIKQSGHDHKQNEIMLVDKDANQVNRMRISLPGEKPYSLLSGPEGFLVEGIQDFQLDQAEAAMMARNLAQVQTDDALGKIELKNENLAAFGLDHQALRIFCEYADGDTKEFILGGPTGTEIPGNYLMIAGDDQVYTVSAAMKSMFDRSLNTLHTLPKINFNGKLLDRVTFSGKETFTLNQHEGLWEVISPIKYPVDETKARKLLDGIAKMRLAVYVGKATESALKQYGFGSDSNTISFELAKSIITRLDDQGNPVQQQNVSEQVLSLSIGHPIDHIGFYCLYDGSIYQASHASMGFLNEFSIPEVLSRSPINIPINRLQRLEISKGSHSNVYEISLVEKIMQNNALAVDGQGNILYEPHVIKDDKEISSDAFLREYLKLMGLSASGTLPAGFDSDQEAEVVILLKQEKSETELALFPFDALHYAMRVNGVYYHYLPKDAVRQISL